MRNLAVICDRRDMNATKKETPPTESAESAIPPTVVKAPEPMLESDARTFSTLAHVSAIVGSVVGVLSWLGPLILFLMFRDRSKLIGHHAREQLNMQLSYLIYIPSAVVLGIVTLGLGFLLTIPALIILAVVFFIGTIVGAVKASRGEYYSFPFIIRFIR